MGPRIDLLINLAEAKECDLVARTRKTGYLYRDGRFVPASAGHRPLLDAELRTKATKRYGEVTYTCVPPGSGQRMARGRN
ncbi:MAG TPA: hypothetical protein VE844_13680 [Gammaproteobacteria bacterium]|nr:hypothetical protein [Gammaproteobacteria bacterium]